MLGIENADNLENRTSLVWWFLAEFRCHKLKWWQQLPHFCDFPRDLLDFVWLLYNICTVFQVYPSPLVVCSMIPSVSKMSVRGIFQTSPNLRTVPQWFLGTWWEFQDSRSHTLGVWKIGLTYSNNRYLQSIGTSLRVDLVDLRTVSVDISLYFSNYIPQEFRNTFGIRQSMGTNGRSEDYFVDPWNVFDYCLVVFSVADLASGLSSAKVAGLQLFFKRSPNGV